MLWIINTLTSENFRLACLGNLEQWSLCQSFAMKNIPIDGWSPFFITPLSTARVQHVEATCHVDDVVQLILVWQGQQFARPFEKATQRLQSHFVCDEDSLGKQIRKITFLCFGF